MGQEEEQKKLDKEKLNKPEETVYNANKEKMGEDNKFDKKLNKLKYRVKYRAGANDKSKMLDKLKQEQKQLSVIVIEKKVDETKLQKQEQHNVRGVL